MSHSRVEKEVHVPNDYEDQDLIKWPLGNNELGYYKVPLKKQVYFFVSNKK